MSATLVNGESPGCISISNRGLAYGDGVFTTVKVVDQRLQLWQLHRRRLSRDCRKLSLTVDFESLEHEIARLCKRLPPLGVLKIILTRSEAQRGYRPSCNDAVRILQAAPYTPYPNRYTTRALRSGFAGCAWQMRLHWPEPSISTASNRCWRDPNGTTNTRKD